MLLVALLATVFLSTISQQMLTVFQLPGDAGEDYVEYTVDSGPVSTFSICLYFKPAYQLNKNVQILLTIPGFITVGIYEDSIGGWLEIGTENIIFDFPAALYPRTWNSFCIQQSSVKRKIWHENQIIYEEDITENINFNIKVKYI